MPDSTSRKKNEVDTQAVVKLFVEAVRQKRKRQTPGVKRTRGGIVTKLTKEIGITRDMALFMLRDMQKYKIRDIEPKYMNHHLSAKNALKNKPGKKPKSRKKPKPSTPPSDELSVGLLDEVSKLPGE
jgi:hypothetical protein